MDYKNCTYLISSDSQVDWYNLTNHNLDSNTNGKLISLNWICLTKSLASSYTFSMFSTTINHCSRLIKLSYKKNFYLRILDSAGILWLHKKMGSLSINWYIWNDDIFVNLSCLLADSTLLKLHPTLYPMQYLLHSTWHPKLNLILWP